MTKWLVLCNNFTLQSNWHTYRYINTLRPRQNGRHFVDDTFKPIFLNENIRISIKISLKFVPKAPINNIPALDQIMAWRWPGDTPLSEPMMVSFPMHICVTRPQWVNPSGAETRIFWEGQVSIMVANALVPYVTRPSAAMVLTF